MTIRRLPSAVAASVAAALLLSGCTAASEVIQGSSVSVALSQPFSSYNEHTSFGQSPTNAAISYATNGSFGYYDDTPAWVKDESFGSYEKLSDDPLRVKYTIADGVRWSDGTAVDAADLLLNWVALSGAYDTPDFDAQDYIDPDTGEFTDDFPADTVYFDSGADPSFGLGLVTNLPEVSDDLKSITMTYDAPFVDWEQAFTDVGLPAHIVAKNALGIDDNQKAKDALIAAIVDRDDESLAAISAFWRSGFNFTQMPADQDLLVGNGPYTITNFVANNYLTLTANPNYVGAHLPAIEEVTVRFIGDPLAAVQALQNGAVQVIAPQPTEDVARALDTLDVSVVAGYEDVSEHIDLQFDKSKNGLFDDPLIREAFMKVVPRQEIVDELISPLQPTATTRDSRVFLPGSEGYDESVVANGSAAYAEVDVSGAQALLTQAGVTNPEVCILFSSTNPRRASEFVLIQESAALAGFVVTDCSSPDWTGLLGTPGAYDAALFGWESTGLGVTKGPLQTYGTGGALNLNYYSSPEMDALIDDLAKEFDRSTQIDTLEQIDKLLWQDFYGVTLFQFPAVTAFDQSMIANVSASPLAPSYFWNIWDWEPVTT